MRIDVCLRTLVTTVLLLPAAALAQLDQTGDATSGEGAKQQNDRAERLGEMADDFSWKGVTPTIGVVASGSGLAAGFSFESPSLQPLDMSVAADASISVRNYQHLAVRVGRLSNRPTSFRLDSADSSPTSSFKFASGATPGWALYVEQRYRRLPALSLFGTSDGETLRTDYGQRLQSIDLVYQRQVTSRVGVAARLSGVASQVFAGTDDKRPNAEDVFPSGLGLAARRDVRYVAIGWAVGWDLRDKASRPGRGGVVGVGLWRYTARTDGFSSFGRLTIDARVYRRFLSSRHVMAARLVGAYTTAGTGGETPFTSLQSLGGSSALRSFSSYRFRGRHVTGVIVESRWRVENWLELVPFVDMGRVTGRPLWPQATATELSAGMGARFWLADKFAIRAELGAGSDGPRLVATIDSPF